jgi:hypothetical protein
MTNLVILEGEVVGDMIEDLGRDARSGVFLIRLTDGEKEDDVPIRVNDSAALFMKQYVHCGDMITIKGRVENLIRWHGDTRYRIARIVADKIII